MRSENSLSSLTEVTAALNKHSAVLFYFSTLSCSVGEALEPKVRDLISKEYPKIEFIWIDMNVAPEVLGAHQVFVEPTILLFVHGKEYLRRSRNIHLAELQGAIQRIYDLAFSD
jgi:hypothetical protein